MKLCARSRLAVVLVLVAWCWGGALAILPLFLPINVNWYGGINALPAALAAQSRVPPLIGYPGVPVPGYGGLPPFGVPRPPGLGGPFPGAFPGAYPGAFPGAFGGGYPRPPVGR